MGRQLIIPISGKVLWTTGDLVLWVDLDLLLKDQAGVLHQESFRVDTGTQIMTMLAFDAKGLGLPLPVARAPVQSQPTGLEVRSGFLRFRVAGLGPTEYAIAGLFLGGPDTPPPSQLVTSKLLQPLQLLEHLRFTFDRDSSVGAPYGTMAIEEKTP